MHKLSLTILVFLTLAVTASAQEFSVESFRSLEMDMDARSVYPVYDQNNKKAALIKVVTTEKDFDFDVGMMGVLQIRQEIGEIWVYVPAGVMRITIRHPKYGVIRDYYFPSEIEVATVYELKLVTPKNEVIPFPVSPPDTTTTEQELSTPVPVVLRKVKKDQYLVMATVGLYPDLSYGVTLGWTRKAGAYLKLRSDFNFPAIAYSCDEKGYIDGGGTIWTDGASTRSRLSFTAGAMVRALDWLYPYLGVGYGTRIYALRDTEGNWVKVKESSKISAAVETGAIFRIKKFAISAGVATVGFKYWDTEISVGVMF